MQDLIAGDRRRIWSHQASRQGGFCYGKCMSRHVLVGDPRTQLIWGVIGLSEVVYVKRDSSRDGCFIYQL